MRTPSPVKPAACAACVLVTVRCLENAGLGSYTTGSAGGAAGGGSGRTTVSLPPPPPQPANTTRPILPKATRQAWASALRCKSIFPPEVDNGHAHRTDCTHDRPVARVSDGSATRTIAPAFKLLKRCAGLRHCSTPPHNRPMRQRPRLIQRPRRRSHPLESPMSDVVIVGAKRTAIGSFLGQFTGVPTPQLGVAAITGALEQAGIAPDQVQEVIMGCVLPAGLGQAPARQAAL